MRKKETLSGTETMFKDKDGNPIKIHDYVKDAEGNRYYINSSAQAVPDGGDAPAMELDRLLETTQLSIMPIEEVLNMKQPVERRRRGGRRPKAEAAEVKEDPNPAEKKEAPEAGVDKEQLHPVTEEMVLAFLPDDVLAKELRRRGYTLCAVRPALIML